MSKFARSLRDLLQSESPRLVIVGARASAHLQDGVLAVFDSTDPRPEDQPILVLDMNPSLDPHLLE